MITARPDGGTPAPSPADGLRARAADASGDALLIDFGLARRLPPCGHVECPTDRAGRFGILGFMAPEVQAMRGGRYGLAVDVFAYGRLLYALLSAAVPPPRDLSPRALHATAMGAALGLDAPPWAYVAQFCERPAHAAWPAGLSSLAKRCTASEPACRPDAAQIVAELQLAMGMALAGGV